MNIFESSEFIKVFREIVKTDVFEHFATIGTLTDFIAEIWPLESMDSTDYRFKNLYGDIHQHCVNNRDYPMMDVFVGMLAINQSKDKIKRFLEVLPTPNFYESLSSQTEFIRQFNLILSPFGLRYKLLKYDPKGMAVYMLTEGSSTLLDCSIPLNKIPFFVIPNPSGRADKVCNHPTPSSFPAFVLVYDDWDDFGARTTFTLFYYESEKIYKYIGSTKILNETEKDNIGIGDKYRTIEYLPDEFAILPTTFCSLGQDIHFYKNLLEVFGSVDKCKEILWALKDCSIFPSLVENFESHKEWFSLVRSDNAERMLREASFILEGNEVQRFYQFEYCFFPKYADKTTIVSFNFERKGYLPRRLYGLIGKNGVGKTQFITSLPLHLSTKNNDYFNNHVPIFSKVIAISNSYYDNFEIPDVSAEFNYVYCGLSRQKRGGDKSLLTLDEMKGRILEAGTRIREKNRISILSEILQIVFTQRQLVNIIIDDEDGNSGFNNVEISRLCDVLSSGETSMLYILFVLIANIRLDSLLLFDEPETHLHPNAITELMTAIYNLLEKFESFAIITTHSPLIIREMKSDSVYIMERDEQECLVRKIGVESLGASPSILIDEIFDNKGIQKHYKQAILKMKNDGMSYEEIINEIQTDNVPLGLGLEFYIRNIFNPRDNEEGTAL